MQDLVCPHYTPQSISSLNRYRATYTDECAKCFTYQESGFGMDICLSCMSPGCPKHSIQHANQTSHPFVLRIKTKKLEEEYKEEDTEEHDFEVYCLKCQKELDPAKFEELIAIVLENQAAPYNNITHNVVWERQTEPCPHTTTIVQTNSKKLTDKALAHCAACDLTNNLWLCLICGSLGCGRKAFDGTGGNGHAKNHFAKTGHSVAVKMGTITPEGAASVHCYECDDEVEDDELAEHLANFGINIGKLEKTEKTIDEMNIHANATLDLNKMFGQNIVMQKLYGKGFIGIQRQGKSSYVSAVLQLMFSIEEFQARYCTEGLKHLENCTNYGPDCFECQISKLANALYGEQYPQVDKSDEESGNQTGIKPGMFKEIIKTRCSELQARESQNAIDYLDALLSVIQDNENKADTYDITEIFTFETITRETCQLCQGYKLKESSCSDIKLPIAISENFREDPNPLVPHHQPYRIPLVPFRECLWSFHKGFLPLYCSRCKKKSVFERTIFLKNSPKYLLMTVPREVMTNWLPEKNLSEIIFDSEVQDFSGLKVPEMDPGMMIEDIPIDPQSIEEFVNMGFEAELVKRALIENDGRTGDVLDWLMKYAHKQGKQGKQLATGKTEGNGSYKYQLKGAVVHFGYDFYIWGQYACYVRKEGRWIYYSDERVSESLKPALGKGVIYLFEKCSI